MIFGLARREFFKILFMPVSLPSRSRPLFSGGEKLPLIYRDIFSSFPSGEVGKFFDTGLVAGGMPLGMKRGRHCEKYRPSFGTFCPKGIKSVYLHPVGSYPKCWYQRVFPNPNLGLADEQTRPAEQPHYGISHSASMMRSIVFLVKGT